MAQADGSLTQIDYNIVISITMLKSSESCHDRTEIMMKYNKFILNKQTK